MFTAEELPRQKTDTMVIKAGPVVYDYVPSHVQTGRKVVSRNALSKNDYRVANFFPSTDDNCTGVCNAKNEDLPLTGLEGQADKYRKGLFPDVPSIPHFLPPLYPSDGVEILPIQWPPTVAKRLRSLNSSMTTSSSVGPVISPYSRNAITSESHSPYITDRQMGT